MPSREYRDPSGTQWEVFEVHRLDDRPGAVRPALAGGWLAFVSAGEKRRLPHYPPGWKDSTDDDILELLRQALIVPDPSAPPGTVRRGVSDVAQDENPRATVRRNRPRITPSSASSALSPLPSGEVLPSTTLTASETIDDRAPVPTLPTVRDVLGVSGIDAVVRDHARRARRDGTAVIEGMISVKRTLADIGEDVSPEVLKHLRKVFVDEFYFAAGTDEDERE